MNVGDRVNYTPFEGCDNPGLIENGIIKAIHQRKVGFVYVVYKCGSDWDNYMDYTAALTDVNGLKEGWVEKPVVLKKVWVEVE
jgi:hypothetical protein